MRHFVGVGAHVVVIADLDELGESEQQNENHASGRGCRTAGDLPKHVVEQGDEQRQQRQVAENERAQTGAEKPEPQGVEVLREGPIVEGDVAIEHFTLG